MELFTWMWAFDKRLVCWPKYSKKTFSYIWLMPVFVSGATLILSLLAQITAHENDLKDCLHLNGNDDMKKAAHLL